MKEKFQHWQPHIRQELHFHLSDAVIQQYRLGSTVDDLEPFGKPMYSALAPDQLDYHASGMYFLLDSEKLKAIGFGCYFKEIKTVRGPSWQACSLTIVDESGKSHLIGKQTTADELRRLFPRNLDACDPGHNLLLKVQTNLAEIQFSFSDASLFGMTVRL